MLGNKRHPLGDAIVSRPAAYIGQKRHRRKLLGEISMGNDKILAHYIYQTRGRVYLPAKNVVSLVKNFQSPDCYDQS